MTTKMKPCPECDGTGRMIYERAYQHSASRDVGEIEEYEEDCENCCGDGEIEDEEYEEYEDDEDERGDWLYQKRKDEELDRG